MSLAEEERLDSGTTGAVVIPRLHLSLHEPTEEEKVKIDNLRKVLGATPYMENEAHKEWLTDRVLLRFLIARNFDQDKAKDMLMTALAWRDVRKPHTLTAMSQELEYESKTGKIYVAGHDRWERPVLIFNNSVNNSADPDAQMRYLAFNIEHCLKEVAAGKICKFTIFMHMYNFSLLNTPPFKVTRETIQMLTTCYPETMGHCIIYLPPRIFSAFFDSVKRLIDPRTASKIVMITGDCSAGSPNDKTMCELIGPEWKKLTGAEQPVIVEKCSPGFDHAEYWPRIQEREKELLRRSLSTGNALGIAHAPASVATPAASVSPGSRSPRAMSLLPPTGNIFKGLVKSSGRRKSSSSNDLTQEAAWPGSTNNQVSPLSSSESFGRKIVDSNKSNASESYRSQRRHSAKSAPPLPSHSTSHHHHPSIHLAGSSSAGSPSTLPKVLALTLLSAATAMAWCGAVCRPNDPSIPTASWFCSAQSRFIETFTNPVREPGEDLVILLLAITTFFILGAYPNRYILNYLPFTTKFTPGGRTLYPLKQAPTQTYVLTADTIAQVAVSGKNGLAR